MKLTEIFDKVDAILNSTVSEKNPKTGVILLASQKNIEGGAVNHISMVGYPHMAGNALASYLLAPENEEGAEQFRTLLQLSLIKFCELSSDEQFKFFISSRTSEGKSVGGCIYDRIMKIHDRSKKVGPDSSSDLNEEGGK